MKRLKLISFTEAGGLRASAITEKLDKRAWLAERSSVRPEDPCYTGLSLSKWTEEAFKNSDAIVFVGACGIAVRSIAPHIRSKASDPAVVVVDDQGRYAISLLSGHMGGANDLAREIAGMLGAEPVITTATDNAGLFAVDEWAKKQGMAICGLTEAKMVSAALLAGKAIGFASDFKVQGRLPAGLEEKKEGEIGISITLGEKEPFKTTLRLIPPVVALGIGCRRGTQASAIREAAEAVLKAHGISPLGIGQICSIDLKSSEEGLLTFCDEMKLSLETFSSDALAQAPGRFTASPFVESVTGVDNVCERSAVLGSGGGELIIKKQVRNGVTVAAARKDYTVRFIDRTAAGEKL